MFYSDVILAKRGALSKVWVAAHWTKRLTRKQISDANVVEACNTIIKPPVELALRTSGHLLLGVVKIHDEKQSTLVSDCNLAFHRIQVVFRPDAVDAPNTTAAYATITMQDELVDFDDNMFDEVELPPHDEFIAPRDDLMMEEDFVTSSQFHARGAADELDDAFPPFMEPEVGRHDTTVEQGRDRDDTTMFEDTMDKPMETSMARLSPDPFPPMLEDMPEPDLAEPDAAQLQGGDAAADTTMPELPAAPHTATVWNVVEDADEIELPARAAAAPAPTRQGNRLSKRRSRKLVIDAVTTITNAEMKANLAPGGNNDLSLQPWSAEFWLAEWPQTGQKRRFEEHFDLTEALQPSLVAIAANPTVAGVLRKRFRPVQRADYVPERIVETELPFVKEDLPEPDAPDFNMTEDMQPGAAIDFDLEPPEFNDPLVPEADTEEATTSLAQSARKAAPVRGLDDEEDEEEDEMLVTSAQFEAAGWSKRTKKMLSNFQTYFQETDELSYETLTTNHTRRAAAQTLLEVLVLKSKGFIDVEQAEPFGDISLTARPLMMQS
ncbi:uncharacterized protein MONBRDRAFT_35988 [Monosiga brevicollis MX1]|uniref:Rad21/Rec8-like protein N-terminal domain-containing protein n=1 Tax=Monosiga brevicollis TaxID=81824 RepID=A9UR71_MONBE|nr:uncharacterized protein MONBRDRAFT_35988 [Monosiga brevicollis MX1]EDQ91870.1 predicted protein [Monosiga brevicollis MX1]|eukprot:XP_001743156.1 hypothetical protein [Monosiga brevicollis MX1]